ncbi:MAG: alpha/beta hydrolase [Polyangia bacterium]
MQSAIRTDDGVDLSLRVFAGARKATPASDGAGSGAGDAAGDLDVILMHGWMMSGAVFDDLIEQLGPLDLDGLRLIVPDQRGSGRSGRPEHGYSLARYAADVLAVADAVGARRFVIVGHSMGGQIAQLVAAEHPDRVLGVVLLCPVPATGMALPADAQALFRGCGGQRDMQRTILDLACKQLEPARRERLLDDSLQTGRACIEQAFDSWTAGGLRDRLPHITAPTLVVATDDPFLPPPFLREEVVRPIAKARLGYLPGPGHYPQVERPRETAALLTAFLTPLLARHTG